MCLQARKPGEALRRELKQQNGLPELELFTVEEDPVLAAEIFIDAGFVLVPGALSKQKCHELLLACKAEEAEMRRRDPLGLGNRGRGRYSLGEAQLTGHILHRLEWASLVDLEKAKAFSSLCSE